MKKSSDKVGLIGSIGDKCLSLDTSDLYEWSISSTWELINPQPIVPYSYFDICDLFACIYMHNKDIQKYS